MKKLLTILMLATNLGNCSKIANLNYREKELSDIEKKEILNAIVKNDSLTLIKNIDKILDNFNKLDNRGKSIYHYFLLFSNADNIALVIALAREKGKIEYLNFDQRDLNQKPPLLILLEDRRDKNSIDKILENFSKLKVNLDITLKYQGESLYKFFDKKIKNLESNIKFYPSLEISSLMIEYNKFKDKFSFAFGFNLKEFMGSPYYSFQEKNMLLSIAKKDLVEFGNIIKKNSDIGKHFKLRRNEDFENLMKQSLNEGKNLEIKEHFDVAFLCLAFDWLEGLKILDKYNMIDINKKYANGNSLLHWAVNRRNNNFVKFLLEKGIDPNSQNESFCTPLTLMCDSPISKFSMEIVKNLIKFGANINKSPNDSILFPLGLAINNSNIELMRFLINNGADINIELRERPKVKTISNNLKYIFSSLEIALAQGDNRFLEIILKKCEKLSFLKSSILLWQFTEYGLYDMLERLLNLIKEIDLNPIIVNKIGTPLFIACSNENMDKEKRKKIVELLLSKGDDPNYVRDGESLLSMAANQNDYELCSILLKAGAKPYLVGANYQPIHKAIVNENEELAILLLEYSDDPNYFTINKSSTLSLAIRLFGSNPNSILINKLLENPKTKIRTYNHKGASPLLDALFRDIELFKKISIHDDSKYVINENSNLKFPIIHLATAAGRNKHLKFLIERGYNPFEINKKSSFYESVPEMSDNLNFSQFYIGEKERAIDIAIRSNELLAFSLIIEIYKEKDLESKFENFIRNNYIFGNKTLIVNIQKGYIGVVKTILKYSNFKDLLTLINYMDEDSKTSLDYALKLDDIELQSLLKQIGAIIGKEVVKKIEFEQKENSFINQIIKGNVDKSVEMIKQDIENLVTADEDNTTCLIACSKYNQYNILEIIIKEFNKIKKLNSNINRVDIQNKTALSYAIDNKNSKILNLLLENGANPNFRYSRTYSYLVDLAFDNSEEASEIINMLFKYEIKLNAKDIKFLVKNRETINNALLKLFEKEIKEYKSLYNLSKKTVKTNNIKTILISNDCLKEFNNLSSSNLKKLKDDLEKAKRGENLSDTRDLKGYSTKFSEIKINNDRVFYIKKGEYFIIIDIYINKHQDSLPSKYYNYVHNKAKNYKFMIENNSEALKINTKDFYETDKIKK